MSENHLIIAAAGTGGHVMPGLAVAEEMKKRGWTVSWIGTPVGMEGRLVGSRQIEFDTLDFTGMRGKGLSHMLGGSLKLVKSCFAARSIVKSRQATVLFSTGGYIAVPAAFGARTCGIPLVMMNCDADSLMSVRAVMPYAAAVMCGFDGECAKRAGGKAIVSGNPIREEILALTPPAQRYAGRSGPLRILVFGGSLGAKVLNDTVPEAIALFDKSHCPEVMHQCGKNNAEVVQAHYERLGVKAKVMPFIDDMAAAYAWALLVPFVVSTTQHQLGNAKYLEAHQAGVYIDQKALSAQSLFEKLNSLDREALIEMAENARKLSHRDAAKTVADQIERLVAK